MNHVTVGVYLNRDFTINIVKPEHLHSHVNYNVEHRWGRALFVDGKCVVEAGFPKYLIEEWEERISLMNIDSSVASPFYR